MKKFAPLQQAIKAFHEDEDGMESIQVVILLAIAAVVLAVLATFWEKISTWAGDLIDEVLTWGG